MKKHLKYQSLIDDNIFASRHFMSTVDNPNDDRFNVLDQYRKHAYQVLLFINKAAPQIVSAVFISLMEAEHFSLKCSKFCDDLWSFEVPDYDVYLYDPLAEASSRRLSKMTERLQQNAALKRVVNCVMILSGSYYEIQLPFCVDKTKSWMNAVNRSLALELYGQLLYMRNKDAYMSFSNTKDGFLLHDDEASEALLIPV